MYKFLRFSISAILSLACVVCLWPPQSINVEQKKLLVASFDQVWAIVRDKHYDPELGGLNWQSVYKQFKPRIYRAASHEEGRDIMNEMLGLLNQTHISVIPASAYKDLQGESTGSHTPGLNIRVLDGRAIVTNVETVSHAAKTGVMPGWEVLSINGKDVGPIIKRIEEHTKGTLKSISTSRVIEALLSGQASEAVEVEFHDGKTTKIHKLERAEPKGTKLTFGNMPPAYFWVETSSTEQDIRVIRFNIWLNPKAVADAFAEIMKDSESAKGFIIDLRGNPGGIGGMAMGAAGWFTPQKGLKLGTTIMRGTKVDFVIFPRPGATNAPLAILVDGCSASTSEIFAGGMQDLKRARIFGTHTAGAALPSAFIRLANGDGFQYIVANYISEGGKPLEGLGVTPDETVELTQAELLAGKDTVMDRAVAWILESK